MSIFEVQCLEMLTVCVRLKKREIGEMFYAL